MDNGFDKKKMMPPSGLYDTSLNSEGRQSIPGMATSHYAMPPSRHHPLPAAVMAFNGPSAITVNAGGVTNHGQLLPVPKPTNSMPVQETHNFSSVGAPFQSIQHILPQASRPCEGHKCESMIPPGSTGRHCSATCIAASRKHLLRALVKGRLQSILGWLKRLVQDPQTKVKIPAELLKGIDAGVLSPQMEEEASRLFESIVGNEARSSVSLDLPSDRIKTMQVFQSLFLSGLEKLDLPASRVTAKLVAVDLEFVLHQIYGNNKIEYNSRARSIKFNLGKNPALMASALTGVLSMDRLALMGAEEMASEEQKEFRQKKKKEYDWSRLKVPDDLMIVRKTESGIELIEAPGATPVPLPPRLPNSTAEDDEDILMEDDMAREGYINTAEGSRNDSERTVEVTPSKLELQAAISPITPYELPLKANTGNTYTAPSLDELPPLPPTPVPQLPPPSVLDILEKAAATVPLPVPPDPVMPIRRSQSRKRELPLTPSPDFHGSPNLPSPVSYNDGFDDNEDDTHRQGWSWVTDPETDERSMYSIEYPGSGRFRVIAKCPVGVGVSECLKAHMLLDGKLAPEPLEKFLRDVIKSGARDVIPIRFQVKVSDKQNYSKLCQKLGTKKKPRIALCNLIREHLELYFIVPVLSRKFKILRSYPESIHFAFGLLVRKILLHNVPSRSSASGDPYLNRFSPQKDEGDADKYTPIKKNRVIEEEEEEYQPYPDQEDDDRITVSRSSHHGSHHRGSSSEKTPRSSQVNQHSYLPRQPPPPPPRPGAATNSPVPNQWQAQQQQVKTPPPPPPLPIGHNSYFPVEEEEIMVIPITRMPTDEELHRVGINPIEFHQTLEFASSAGPKALDMARGHERTNFPFLHPGQPTFSIFLSALKWKVLEDNQNTLPSEWYTFFQENKQHMATADLHTTSRRQSNATTNNQGFSVKDYKESFKRRFIY